MTTYKYSVKPNPSQGFLQLSFYFALAILVFRSSSHIAYGDLPAPNEIEGTYQVAEVKGSVSRQIIPYTIYFPPGYDTSNQTYPVLWYLHGLNGDHESQAGVVIPAFESAYAESLVRPLIIVFPGVGRNTMWADTKNGDFSAETNVIRELIPHVDKTYRTINHRNRRVICGFSMGGYGAMLYGAKFPELFSVAINFDGAMHTLSSLKDSRTKIADLFERDEIYFDEFSPWKWTSENAEVLKSQVAFRAAVGSIQDKNRAFRDHMRALGIPYDYTETPCGHVLHCIFTHAGEDSWQFIEKNFTDNKLEYVPKP